MARPRTRVHSEVLGGSRRCRLPDDRQSASATDEFVSLEGALGQIRRQKPRIYIRDLSAKAGCVLQHGHGGPLDRWQTLRFKKSFPASPDSAAIPLASMQNAMCSSRSAGSRITN